MPSVKDVALAAGVSPMTVSNVFSGRVPVRDRTRQRVLAAAKKLGYLPHGPAQALRTGRSFTIALSLPLITNLTMAAMAQSASREACAAGYMLSVSPLEYNAELERAHFDALARQRVAVVIAIPVSNDPRPYVQLQQTGTPVVFVDRRPPGITADLLASDHRTGTLAAVRHLLATGRRRVAMLMPPAEIGSSVARIEGYVAAYAEAGLPAPSDLFRPGLLTQGDAYRVTAEFLDQAEPPDAIIATGPSLTLGAQSCLRERAVQIPAEMAFVGTGDVRWAGLVEPPLTVVEVDGEELGRRAVGMAIERLEGQASLPPARDIYLPTRLVIRGSTVEPGRRLAADLVAEQSLLTGLTRWESD